MASASNSNWQGLPDTLTTERLEIPNYAALAAQNEGALRLNQKILPLYYRLSG